MVHQYRNNGYNIVLDVNSGAVHVVDEVTYDVIALYRELEAAGNRIGKPPEDGDAPAFGKPPESVTQPEIAGSAGSVAASGEKPRGGSPEDGDVPDFGDAPENITVPGSGTSAKTAPRGGPPDRDEAARMAEDKLSGRYGEDEVREAIGEVHALMDEGALFTPDLYEDYAGTLYGRPTVVKALCLHIAHGCNLACRYCFAGKGEYHGRKALMPSEVGKKALDFLIENSGGRRNLEVDFFGGEPLLNWQVVKDLVAYGRAQEKLHDKKFRFTLTTNGVLLDREVMDFCNREMANVVLSVDGRREVHDKMRPFRDGAGSYDAVVPKFLEFAESRGQQRYYVRGTYTRENLDFSEDVLHLADLGFTQISVEPVVAPPTEPYALREEDLPQLFREYDRLAAEMVRRKREGKGFHFFHFMIDLEGGPCVAKRLLGCGSGTEYLAVTPWGDFYPCHQFVGNEKFLLGNVDSGLAAPEIRERFGRCSVYAKEKCRDCFAKFYCSGGCAANAYNFTGDILGTYDIGCELQKKRVECAIMIKAAELDG